ncbi:MAG: major facilitator transporter [uncultured bacterium (gcode 4)]|uniref:Major facilitator transporter n=1 Tax=uncultured bacterium (gcode 4) TaxID=1234023 RepID=K2BB24_9BACT|nr:MAG: major facilitator transporter [uncultured bacterium (gcode 4)]
MRSETSALGARKSLYTLLTLSFLDILGFSFILPVLPFIVKSFWGNSLTVWITVSAAAVWMFIWGIMFGRLSDRYWRKNIILISIVANIIGYILFWFSKSLEFFILSRFICGIGGWGISVIQASVGDISNDKNRIANMWLVGASLGLGFTIWPIFGSFLEEFWLRNMWFFSAIILAISLIVSIFLLPKDTHKIHLEEVKISWLQSSLLILFISFFIITGAFAGIQTIFALYINEIWNFWPKQVAYSFGFLWIISIIYQWFIIWKIGHYIAEKYLIISWLFLVWISFILITRTHNLVIFYILLWLVAIWLSNTNSSIFALISKHSHKKDFWKNMWINTAFWSIADIVWPFVSGILYMEWIKFPFYFFGFLLIFNIIFLYFFLEKE